MLYAEAGAELRRIGKPEHESVHATFSLAFEKVGDVNRAAADLLRLCAFFAPDQIPEEIFIKGAPELGENLGTLATNTLQRTQIIGQACRFSLLHRDTISKTLSIHRQVQAVLRDMMAEKGEEGVWAERAVRAVNSAFPPVEFSAWADCERLLPQAHACAELINQWAFEFPEAARLLNAAGLYLYERGRYIDAEPLYQRALAIREKALGPEHPDVATSLNNLAMLYENQGQNAKTEPFYQRSLAIREKALGPEHPDVAISLNNLAALYRAQGQYANAEPLYGRALAILEKALGPEHPDVATSLNNLAMLYRAQGQYAKAEPLYQRALAILEKALGPEHPDVVKCLENYALFRASSINGT
jgi:tetratricopeptide (TPR) repeat protein